MITNTRYFKISSKLETTKDLNLDEDITITIEGQEYKGTVVKIEFGTNNDGTSDIVYKIKV